jgi:small subunit ribosomal protein S21
LAEERETEANENLDSFSSDESDDYQETYQEPEKRKRRSRNLGEAVICRPLEVVVRDDRVEQAIRQLKNRMAREGVLRELKNRRHYFKPSELKRIKSREAARRRRKQARQKPN